MIVPEAWLHVLTKDDLAAACLEAVHPALPTKALKADWVAHASGHLCVHHIDSHGLEKLCKHEHLEGCKGKPKAQLIKLLQAQLPEAAVQPDILAAFGQLNINPPTELSLVSPERLSALIPQRLQDLCRARVLPALGSKNELIQSLRHDSVSLEELSKSELKALCAAESLAVSGTRAALIARLQASQGDRQHVLPQEQQTVQQQQLARAEAVIQQGDLLQAGKKMVSKLRLFLS